MSFISILLEYIVDKNYTFHIHIIITLIKANNAIAVKWLLQSKMFNWNFTKKTNYSNNVDIERN